MTKNYRIGIIGLGDMANAHIQGLSVLPQITISAICDIHAPALTSIGDKLQIPINKRYTDYRLLIHDVDVDAVISVTPNTVHADIMIACISAGKPFLSEKPFVMNIEEAELVKLQFEQQPVPGMIGFSYRYTPAFRYVKSMLSENRIGQVRSFFVQYLQGWGSSIYDVPFLWRFDKKLTGTGTLGDLGSHMIDLTHYLIGSFKEVSANLETFVTHRKSMATGEMREVEVDDFASFQARMTGGEMGLFQTTRNAIGSGNQLEISLYGEKGTLHASTDNPEQVIWIYVDSQSGEVVREQLPVPDQVKLTQWEDFAGMLSGAPNEGLPSLMEGYQNQRVLDAVIRSHERKQTIIL